MSETATVRAILELLRAHRIPAWRVNTGAFRAEYKGRSRFHRFGSVGMSDIVGIMPGDERVVMGDPGSDGRGRFLAIEVKSRTGRVTPAQSAFLDDVRTAGGVAFVAHTVDEAAEKLGLLKENSR